MINEKEVKQKIKQTNKQTCKQTQNDQGIQMIHITAFLKGITLSLLIF